ncbi:MAG TPA: hypothetical protein VN112_16485 [Ensifer sp.]|nr:hypothetical protein [Ensifer sp.]
MHILWDKQEQTDDGTDRRTDWAIVAGELESGLPFHSGRALTWLSVTQALIQVSGLLFIIYACLQ